MWNPPITDEKLATRRSPLAEAADLLAELVVAGRAHDRVHEVAQGGRADGASSPRSRSRTWAAATSRERIAPYRAGYTAQQRRELEQRLVEGELLGVVSTDALELGIDIGSLDAAICVTFPGTVASLRQMWGRAGRRGRGLAVYVAGEDALDQFFCRHPDEFLDRPVEAAILDHENEQIHAAHLLCAAHEGPLEPADDATLGPGWRRTADVLVSAGELRRRPNGTFVPRADRRLPGRRRGAALREPRQRRDRRHAARASCSAPSTSRARTTPRTRARSTSTAGAPSRSRRSTSSSAARSCTRSRATGTRSPSARPTRTSSACSTAARRWA